MTEDERRAKWAAQQRAWRANNRDKYRQRQRTRYARNKEQTKDQRSDAHARYYQKHKQRILARMRERRDEINRIRRERYARDAEYRARCRELQQRWTASNPEKVKAMRKEIRRRYRISARGKETERRWKKKNLGRNRERINARRRKLMRDPQRKAKRDVAQKAYYQAHRRELNARRRDRYNTAMAHLRKFTRGATPKDEERAYARRLKQEEPTRSYRTIARLMGAHFHRKFSTGSIWKYLNT